MIRARDYLIVSNSLEGLTRRARGERGPPAEAKSVAGILAVGPLISAWGRFLSEGALLYDAIGCESGQELILARFAPRANAFGLTIYFPADERAYTVNPDTYDGNAYDRTNCDKPLEKHAVEFVFDNKWSEFLPIYYARLKPKSLSSNAAALGRCQQRMAR